ncbi:MAG: manganese efflux pump MntP family protein [Bacillota bacterium]|nr:manganese efflux pump MntP family protein [Bacillota bacterium]
MSFIDIFLISVGLAMDAAAVSMTNGMVYRNLKKSTYLAMPLFFGAFQAAMPVLGYYIGGIFAELITRYSGIVIFVILGIIGGKMIKEGIADIRENNVCPNKMMTLQVLLFQSVATSIDAFAVGIGFSAMRMSIWMPVTIIGLVTAVIVVAAIIIGRKFGNMLGCKAEILGGVILVIIGIKALI